jgi:ABC-type iron transport system FetAB permease component
LHQELEVQYLQSLLKISITIQVSKSQKLSLEKKMDKSDLNMSLKPIILLSLQLIFKDKKLLMKLQENN